MNSAEQFEAIVNHHYGNLYRFALSLTRSESDAGDLVQQTFYVWATKGHQLRDISKVKTWLFTTLHRAFLETRRKQTRFPHFELSESEHELPEVAPEIVNRLDCHRVFAALADVDEIYRAAVALFYMDSCPYKDIAAILEIPVGTVKSRVSRGVEQLRKILLAEGVRASASAVKESSPTPGPDNRHPLQKPGLLERGYDDWDFGSTLLLERLEIAWAERDLAVRQFCE